MTQQKRTPVGRDEVMYEGTDGGQLIRVNGVSFRPGYPFNLLTLGDKYKPGQAIPVTLEREPENKFDPRAIKVLIEGEHVGYIPKALNEPIQEAMDRGETYSCRVDEVLVAKSKPRQPGLVIHVLNTSKVPALPAGGEGE